MDRQTGVDEREPPGQEGFAHEKQETPPRQQTPLKKGEIEIGPLRSDEPPLDPRREQPGRGAQREPGDERQGVAPPRYPATPPPEDDQKGAPPGGDDRLGPEAEHEQPRHQEMQRPSPPLPAPQVEGQRPP